MAIIDNPTTIVGAGGGPVTEDTALKYMLENKTNYAGIAAGLTDLTTLPTFTQPAGITTFTNMFDGCTSLTSIGGLTIPTSGAEISYMFRNCSSLTQIPSAIMDGIGSISNANYAFYYCSGLTGALAYNYKNGYSAVRMFYHCNNLTSITITRTAGNGYTNVDYMFAYCSNATSITVPITGANFPDFVTCVSMFAQSPSLRTVTIRCGTGGVRPLDVYLMFSGCSSLETVTLDGTSATNKVIHAKMCTRLSSMFDGCSALTAVPKIDQTQTVPAFQNMFRNCSSLTTIPTYDMSSATNISNYVSGCTSLSNTSLNNIMASLLTATSFTGTKTLKYIGLSSDQATTCTGLSNWSALSAAGWTTGY
jgi:hypothetical protein